MSMKRESTTMNKIYRVIWNSALNCFMVTSELATGKTKSSSGQLRKPALVAALSLNALLSFSAAAANGQLLVNGTTQSLDGYDIATTSARQTAITISNGGDLSYSNGNSSTTGAGAHNVLVQTGSKLDMSDATLSTEAINTYGIMLSGASSANVRDTTITQTGAQGSVGINVTGNSEFTGSNLTINSPYTGLSSNASTVNINGLNINTVTDNAAGISASGGTVTVDGGKIKTQGTSAYGVALSNSAVTNLSNAEIETSGSAAWGLNMTGSSSADLKNINFIQTGDSARGISLTQGSRLTGDNISILSPAYGLLSSNSTVDVSNLNITTGADNAIGILAGGGNLTVDGGSINTSGSGATGVQTQDAAVAKLSNMNITTSADNAIGILAAGGNLTVDGGSINTSGNGALGVHTQNSAVAKLSNMNITTLSPTSIGIRAAGTSLIADNLTINSVANAIYLALGSFTGNNLRINYSGNNSAINSNSGSVLTLSNSDIALSGEGATGVIVGAPNTSLNNVTITGQGSGKGINLAAGGLNAKGLDIKMNNLNTLDDSAAMAVTAGITNISLEDSSIVATGSESRALALRGYGTAFNVKNTRIVADNTAIQTQRDTRMALALSGSTLGATTLLAAGDDSAGSGNYIYLDATDASSLSGDVYINRSGMQDSRISLDAGSQWRGAASDLHTLNLSNNSQWTMTGNSNIGAVNLADSSIIFSHDDDSFKKLVVEGDFASTNGTLVMNTVLGGDDSQHDALQVNGNTFGDTNVIINKAGGSGDSTLQGIEVISVAGESDGNFKQQGRIVAGAYDYRLTRGNGAAAKNWYLMSGAAPVEPTDPVNPVDPSEPTDPEGGDIGPVIPVKPVKMVFRPEAGSYLANMAAANNMFNMRLHDRGGETQYVDAFTGEKKVTSLWMRNLGGHTRSTDSTGQLKTQTNRYVLQLGGDVGKWTFGGEDSLHIGTMAGYGNAQSTTESNVSGLRAKGQVNGYSLGMYGTWYQDEAAQTGMYVDSWAQYNWFNNTVSGEGLNAEKYKSSGITASLESGYTWKIGEKNARESYYLQPKAQLSWMGVKPENFNEANGTRVESTGNANVQTRLGVRAFIKGHNNIDDDKQRSFEPYIEANWIANTKNFGTTLNGVNVSQRGTKNIGELKVGVDGQISPNLNLWGNIGQQMGDKGYSDSSAMLGVKVSF